MTACAALSRLSGAGAIVDALLGTGQEGSPRPPIDEAVRWAVAEHGKGTPVIACDVPTGLDSDTGNAYDPAITASVTVTMGFPKLGLYSYPGRRYAGRIVVETLGLPQILLNAVFPAEAVFIEDARRAMPVRLADHHKGLSGHVTVIAGSQGMAGAAVLASKAALRGGAGTVTLLCPGLIYQVCAAMAQEVMVVPSGAGPVFSADARSVEAAAELAGRSSCVVVGPGLGRGDAQMEFLRQVLPRVSSAGVPCLIDADALYALAELGGLSYLAYLKGKFILTPHPGELSRLVGSETQAIGKDRASFARKSALESKSTVCLKGAGTCVANSLGQVRINTSGDPAMATAGSGDVLSGVVAALVSQGLPPADAAWLGVFWHGLAGEMARREHGSCGVLAGDISDAVPAARQVIEGR
jgi:NAD(P)H-hydrate epimerase